MKKIENKWTEDSGDYDDMIQKQLSNKRTVSHWTKELKRLLGPEPLRILEVGCGPGFMSIIAARLGHDVKAIDGSSGMVEKARRNMRQYHQQVEICEEDGVTLPLEQEQSYDVILSRDAVWTLYDPEKAFRRWKAVLKPGGRIIYFDGDYRTVEPTLKNKIHMKIADFLIYVTERKTYETDVKENSGIYEKAAIYIAEASGSGLSDIKKGTLCQDPDQREPLAKQTMDDGFLEIRISGKKIYCSSHKEGEVTCKTIRSKITGKEKPAFTAKGSRLN